MSLHYTVHTIMDIIPYIAGNVQLSLCFRRIFLDQFALGICYTVQQRKLVDRTGCSDRWSISCKLAGGKHIRTLSHIGRNCVFVWNLRRSFRNFNASFFVESHKGCILLKHTKTSCFRKVSFGIFSKFKTDRTEKYVTGLLDRSTDIQSSVPLFIPAVDRWCYKIETSCTFNISTVIDNTFWHACNGR